jgi:hypothetical protein
LADRHAVSGRARHASATRARLYPEPVLVRRPRLPEDDQRFRAGAATAVRTPGGDHPEPRGHRVRSTAGDASLSGDEIRRGLVRRVRADAQLRLESASPPRGGFYGRYADTRRNADCAKDRARTGRRAGRAEAARGSTRGPGADSSGSAGSRAAGSCVSALQATSSAGVAGQAPGPGRS